MKALHQNHANIDFFFFDFFLHFVLIAYLRVKNKNQILKRTKNFYGEIVSLLEKHPESPWSIERLELYIFDERFKTKF